MNLGVVGTDTNVGKTVVSSILCLKYQRKYWKPIQSGTCEGTDSQWISQMIGSDKIYREGYALTEPLSPHAAAFAEGIQINERMLLGMLKDVHHAVIEGAGGLLVPVNERVLLIDLFKEFNAPVLLVARSGLGTLNHTLMSIEVLRARKIEPLGVVMVGELNPSNKKAIEFYGQVRVVGEVPPLKGLNRETLIQAGSQIDLKGEIEWT